MRGSILRRTANGYARDSVFFIPARTRLMLGPRLTIEPRPGATTTIGLQGLRLDEDRVPLSGQKRRFVGARLSLSTSIEF